MRLLKMLLLCGMLLCALSLSSCTQLEFSPEALMNAPVLTPEQTEIKDALKAHLGLDENAVQFRYPKAGDYRSAFVMHDLDGDGREEALVFYSLRNSTENKAFINVLTETDTGWVSTCNVGGLSSNVDMVEFPSMMVQGRENLVVGWSSAGGGDRMVSVYSFGEDKLLTREYRGSYTEMLVSDINKDGLENLLLLRANEVAQNASVVLVAVNTRGELKDVTQLTLEEPISGFGKVQIGKLNATTEAIFIDAFVGNGVVTSVIRYDETQDSKNKLVDALAVEPGEKSQTFLRPEAVYCADINGDGMIEIPTMEELPGYDMEDTNIAFATMYATEYYRMGKEGLESAWYGVVDVRAGYRFQFPDNWIGQVTAFVETNKLHFFVYRGDLYDTSEELLTLLTGTVNDKNDTTEYLPLSVGRGVYYAAIPRVEDKNMKITSAQVQESFSVL